MGEDGKEHHQNGGAGDPHQDHLLYAAEAAFRARPVRVRSSPLAPLMPQVGAALSVGCFAGAVMGWTIGIGPVLTSSYSYSSSSSSSFSSSSSSSAAAGAGSGRARAGSGGVAAAANATARFARERHGRFPRLPNAPFAHDGPLVGAFCGITIGAHCGSGLVSGIGYYWRLPLPTPLVPRVLLPPHILPQWLPSWLLPLLPLSLRRRRRKDSARMPGGRGRGGDDNDENENGDGHRQHSHARAPLQEERSGLTPARPHPAPKAHQQQHWFFNSRLARLVLRIPLAASTRFKPR